MDDRWITDWTPSERWPHYTRANAGDGDEKNKNNDCCAHGRNPTTCGRAFRPDRG